MMQCSKYSTWGKGLKRVYECACYLPNFYFIYCMTYSCVSSMK